MLRNGKTLRHHWGKLLDSVRDNCDGAAEPKGFFSPEFSVYLEVMEEESTKSILIGSVAEDATVTWDEEGLRSVSCRNVADANTKLRQFHRK